MLVPSFFTPASARSLRTPDALRFILIAAAVTLHAIFIFEDSLFDMLLTDLGTRMFMASVTGVAGVVVADVARLAFAIMVPVEAEVLFMVKCRRQPALLTMALATVTLDLQVQRISRIVVAAFALFLQSGLQQIVGELTDRAEGFDPLVVTMASHAILLQQLLVEGDILLFAGNGQPFGGLKSDSRHLMAGNALMGTAAEKRGMAGKAIGGELRVSGNRPARANHQMRHEYHQQDNESQIG